MPAFPDALVPNFERRGGSAVVTDSSASSVYPTTPPASTHTHFAPIGPPKIGGSEGGFIGLVVALSVIFVGSCIGVFFLLRNRKHGGRTTPAKSGEVGVEQPAGVGGFPRRRGTLFGFRSTNPSRAGWVRASAGEDEEEWDADADNVHGGRAGGRESVELSRYGYGGVGHGYGRAPEGHAAEETPQTRERGDASKLSSVSSVHLVAPGDSDGDARGFKEPFVPPVRSTSPEEDPRLATLPSLPSQAPPPRQQQLVRSENRQLSAESTATASTAVSFSGGSKFKESL